MKRLAPPCLFSLEGPLRAAPISLLYLAESAVLRGAMLKHAGSLISTSDVFRAFKADVFLVLILFLAFSSLASISPPRLKRMFILLFNAVMILSFISLIAHVALFMNFGNGLSRTYIEHWSQNRSEATAIILNELRGKNGVLFLLQILALSGCLAFPAVKAVKSWLVPRNCRYRKQVGGAFLIIVIMLELFSFVPDLQDVHPAIKANALRTLLSEYGRRPKDPAAQPAIPEDLGFPQPLEFVREADAPPLNVVLVIFESLGWRSSDVFVPGLGTTPFLKSLADRGALVERVYSVVPHTTKALVSLLGGVYPYLEQDIKESLPGLLPERGLAHILKAQGYRTAFFQTANNYENRPQLVSNLGFEVFKGLFDMPAEKFSVTNYFGREERMMLLPSFQWLDSVSREPFFMTLLTLSTHHDYNLPADYPSKDYKVDDVKQNNYLNAVRYTDEFIQDVFRELEKRNLLGNTLLIVIGDHGEAFGEHRGRRGHNDVLYEEVLRTAAVLHLPKVLPGGTVIRGYRSILDLTPTVCELVGLKLKRGAFIGESFLKPVPDDRTLYGSAWSQGTALALRRGPTKYIFWRAQNKNEVFNNLTDPFDAAPLITKNPQMASEIEKASTEVSAWARATVSQYQEREKALGGRTALREKPVFENDISATWDGALTLVGYDLHPLERPAGTSFWIRAGFRLEKAVKRPVGLVSIIKHEGGSTEAQLLWESGAEHWKNVKPGDLFFVERFVRIPDQWPPGQAVAQIGFVNKRSGEFLRLSAIPDNVPTENSLISLGRLKIVLQY